MINNQFIWNDHIDYICGKINKKLGLLRRIKSYILLNARSSFFNSFFLPLFYYGNIIWGGGGNFSLMSDLKVLQNKATRLILDVLAHSSVSEM